jgi:hypothetical protein
MVSSSLQKSIAATISVTVLLTSINVLTGVFQALLLFFFSHYSSIAQSSAENHFQKAPMWLLSSELF